MAMPKTILTTVAALTGESVADITERICRPEKEGEAPAKLGRKFTERQELVLSEIVREQADAAHLRSAPLGARLAAALRYSKQTPASLARAVGVTREATRMWCMGKSQPGDVYIDKIAKAIGVTPGYIRRCDTKGLSPDLPLGRLIGEARAQAAENLLTVQVELRLVINSREEAIQKLQVVDVVIMAREGRDVAAMAREAGGYWKTDDAYWSEPKMKKPNPEDFVFWESAEIKRRPRNMGQKPYTDLMEAMVQKGLDEKRMILEVWKEVVEECKKRGFTETPTKIAAYSCATRIKTRIKKKAEKAGQSI